MGCGRVFGKVSKTLPWKGQRGDKVEHGPGRCDALCEVIEEAVRREQEENYSAADTVSATTSVRSFVSGVTSLQSAKYLVGSKRPSMADDLQSDVPTIDETIADMSDLQDLSHLGRSLSPDRSASPSGSCTGSLALEQQVSWSSKCKSDHSTITPNIDNRPHPLAPPTTCSNSQASWESHGSVSHGRYDIGGCSDVPSVRDDMSVASAPSEISVSFPRGALGRSSSSSVDKQNAVQKGNWHNSSPLNRGTPPDEFVRRSTPAAPATPREVELIPKTPRRTAPCASTASHVHDNQRLQASRTTLSLPQPSRGSRHRSRPKRQHQRSS